MQEQEAHISRQTPRALAQIRLHELYAGRNGPSEEEDVSGPEPDEFIADDLESVVGVSLGPAQTRLLSPRTPAIEKSAAIDATGDFFGPGVDGTIEEESPGVEGQEKHDEVEYKQSHDLPRSQKRTDSTERKSRQDKEQVALDQQRMPSPWRAKPRLFQRTKESRSILRDGLFAGRRRASSDQSRLASTDNWQIPFLSNVGSFPRNFSLTSSLAAFLPGQPPERADSATMEPRPVSASASILGPGLEQETKAAHPNQFDSLLIDGDALPERRPGLTTIPSGEQKQVDSMEAEELPPLTIRPTRLRRSASDQSLHLHRTLSRVSSLGDDSRFENVQEQVNNRLKAIKDSWQDSTIRLPSLPNISLDTFRPDFSFYRSENSRRPNMLPTDSSRNGFTQRLSSAPGQLRQDVGSTRGPKGSGPAPKGASTHPHFIKACSELTGDLVILGGYRGSILRSAEPPHRQLWVPIKVGLNVRKVDLEVGLNPEADENMEKKIVPGGMLTHIGPVDMSRRLLRRLDESENVRSRRLRVHNYGYDWRLDPQYLSRRLIQFLEQLPCNRLGTPKSEKGATVLAHSLGGLITRHAVNQRPDLFAGVVYAGTPHFCVNILGPMRNGDDVLLSSRVLTAQVNFTIRTSYALLPLDGKCFFNKETKEQFPVDFFDARTWIDYRLSPCVARPLPRLESLPPTGISGMVNSWTSAIPGRKSGIQMYESAKNFVAFPKNAIMGGIGQPNVMDAHATEGRDSEAKGNIDTSGLTTNEQLDYGAQSVATTVTIPKDKAMQYLQRTLASVKQFKEDTAYRPQHGEQNVYPPAAVIYGKTTPTVYGAKVKDREAIKRADAYDELAFASGDGVVLAKSAMLPQGYQLIKGGTVSSDRGHVTLLGDLEAVGKALNAVHAARKSGVGLGKE